MANKSESLTHLALQKFKKNLWGVLSFWYIVACLLIAIFAYALAPDSSVNANKMHLAINSKAPGFTVQILSIPDRSTAASSWFHNLFLGHKNAPTEIPISSYHVNGDKLFISVYNEEGLTFPLQEKQFDISTSFPAASSPAEAIGNHISKRTFWLGTDKYGRDFLSRMLIGIRVSLSIGFVAVLISLLIGITLGAVAGYFGGKTDNIIMWLINVTWSIPTLLLVIALTLVLGKGVWQVFIAVGLTMWVGVARVVRGQVMTIKEKQYVTAARALGFNSFRIIKKHILPNVMAPVIVISAANFASAILVESGLSFLGFGAQPPMPSWGAMIKEHYSYIILGKPYLAIIPGLGIMSLVMAFMLIGNALRDALDVNTQ